MLEDVLSNVRCQICHTRLVCSGEFEEPTTLDVYNNTRYRLALRASNLNRGEILSNSGEALLQVPARQGIAWTLIRCLSSAQARLTCTIAEEGTGAFCIICSFRPSKAVQAIALPAVTWHLFKSCQQSTTAAAPVAIP